MCDRPGPADWLHPGLAHPNRTAATTLLALIRTAIVGTVIAIQPVLMAICLEAVRAAPHRAPEGEGLCEVSDPELDAHFRKRLLRVQTDKDREFVLVASGAYLDALGRKYDRFRTGVPLKGLGPHQT